MNITKEITDYAEKLGLEMEGTGGGMDYVVRFFGDVALVLSATDDAGSPDKLDEPALVAVYMDGKIGAGDSIWSQGVSITFTSAKEAMNWMKSVKDACFFGFEWEGGK